MRFKVLITTVVLAAALVAVAIAQTSRGRELTRSLGLSAPREGFTELYFSHPATLDMRGVRGGSPKLESFVIANREHSRVSYSWVIQAGAKGPAVRGAVSVAPGQRVTVEHRVTVRCERPSRIQVRVTLTGRPEFLTDWVTCYV
jgi:hypothetical protein